LASVSKRMRTMHCSLKELVVAYPLIGDNSE